MKFKRFEGAPSYNKHYYFLTYGIAFIALGLASAALGPMLPYLAANVGVSLGEISFLFTAVSLGYLIGSAGGGQLFDRLNGHLLMLLAVILSVVMVFLIPLLCGMIFLLIILFFLGLGQGILDVGANINLLWVYQARVGPYMNGLHFCFGAGAFLSPIILHNVMRWSDGQLTWPFWTIALFTIPGMLGLWLLPSPKNPEQEESTTTTHHQNKGLVIAMVVLFFLYVGVESGFGGWIFTYVTETQSVSDISASYINSIFWGAFTLGRLISVQLTRKFRPSRLLIGNFILAITFLGLVLIFPLTPWAIWIGSAGLGLALSSVFPMLMVLGESRLRISGSVTGLFFLGSSLGSMVVPMILGQIFEHVGSYHIMTSLLIITSIGLVVLFLVIFTSNNAGEKVRN